MRERTTFFLPRQIFSIGAPGNCRSFSRCFSLGVDPRPKSSFRLQGCCYLPTVATLEALLTAQQTTDVRPLRHSLFLLFLTFRPRKKCVTAAAARIAGAAKQRDGGRGPVVEGCRETSGDIPQVPACKSVPVSGAARGLLHPGHPSSFHRPSQPRHGASLDGRRASSSAAGMMFGCSYNG